eukprot:COSAG02_NODE_914_length_15990_cov_9.617897_16_plen_486_part_00
MCPGSDNRIDASGPWRVCASLISSDEWGASSSTDARYALAMAPFVYYVACLLPSLATAYPGKAPWRDAIDVFADGEPVPGLPRGFVYGFQIPILVNTNLHDAGKGKGGTLLAFAQGYVLHESNRSVLGASVSGRSRDGNDGWIDLVMRRSVNGGTSWDKAITVVFRNSTLGPDGTSTGGDYHACQQPTPVVDAMTNKIFLLSSLDNWHMRLQESTDDGKTWTSSSQARDLDSSLRRPGWGLIFTGLPGGIQLQQPNPHAGRLLLCSSAYWSGGEMVNGKITKLGDRDSRYSYTIASDDHGATWHIASDKIQPRHTTECSVAQRHDGAGEAFIYTRIWDRTCKGCKLPSIGRGIARSTDGGSTWDEATLRGLPDTAPDVEGSFASALVTMPDPADASKMINSTCFYVQSPHSKLRTNLTLQKSCGPDAITSGKWDGGAGQDAQLVRAAHLAFADRSRISAALTSLSLCVSLSLSLSLCACVCMSLS